MIRIALISDIHFGKDARSGEYALPGQSINGETTNAVLLTESAVQVMKEQEIDYLFISGDLTSVGSPVEFYYCQKKIDEIVGGAGISNERVIWCSGNHDNDWSIAGLGDKYGTKEEEESNKELTKVACDRELVEIAKEKYDELAGSIADRNMNYKNLSKRGILPSSGIYEDNDIVVFVLNSSSKCVRKDVIEHGSLTIEQLEWLEKNLVDYKDDSRWKILMLHHHPIDYPYPYPSLDISKLEEGSELCKLVGENGIDIVIHGHRHHPRCKTTTESDWSKPVSFICGGSFSVSEHYRNKGEIPNTLHILELSDNVGLLKLYSYEYCTSKGWVRVMEYRDAVPLDRIMYLGKVFTDSETKDELANLVKKTKETGIYKWDELNDSIKYKSSTILKRIAAEVAEKEACEIKVIPLDVIIIQR